MRASKIQQVFVKPQSGANTWPWSGDPVAADIMHAYNVETPSLTGDAIKRTGTRSSFTPIASRPGKRSFSGKATSDFVVYDSNEELAAAFASGTYLNTLLTSSDMVITAESSSHYSVKPQSGSATLFAVVHSVDGLQYKGIDCKGGFSLLMKAGELSQFDWSYAGRWYDAAAGLAAVETTNTFADARVTENATTVKLTIGVTDYDIDFNTLKLDWNPTILQRTGHRGQFGVKDSRIIGREPFIEIDCEMGVNATDLAIITAFEAGTPVTFTYKTAETAPYFEMIATGQITTVPPKDDGGEARHSVRIDLSNEAIESELEMHWHSE